MAVPSADLGDLLVADRAESSLLFPEREQPAFPFERCLHANIEAFLKVAFPRRVVWVGFSLDFDVSCSRHAVGSREVPCLLTVRSEKHPVISSAGLEVFLRFPCVGFMGMSSVYPSFKGVIDRFIYRTKGFLTHYMSMIVHPAPNDGIEFRDQLSGW